MMFDSIKSLCPCKFVLTKVEHVEEKMVLDRKGKFGLEHHIESDVTNIVQSEIVGSNCS